MEEGRLGKKLIVEGDDQKESANPFYIDIPWSPQTYFTIRGSENFHIVLWISKDLSWTQDNRGAALFFGVAALTWCVVLVYHALIIRNWEEVYMLVPFILWLSGNFLWMYGEVYNGDDDYVVPRAAIIMETAIALILLYHIVLRPFKLIPEPSKEMIDKYESADLIPRFSYFRHWREYEHIHTLFWLGKDVSWNQSCAPAWIICLIPTFLIGADFIYMTWKTNKMTIDMAHYIAQLIWVLGNMLWAMGEVTAITGETDDGTAYFIFSLSPEAARQCRWYSAWLLFAAYVPIAMLYFVWLPLTCMGKIKAADIPENEEFGRDSKWNRGSVTATSNNAAPAAATASNANSSDGDIRITAVETINVIHARCSVVEKVDPYNYRERDVELVVSDDSVASTESDNES